MNKATELRRTLRRSLTISGAITAGLLLVVPLSIMLPNGTALGESLSVVWAASLVAVALSTHRFLGREMGIGLVAAVVGIVAMTVTIATLLASLTGLVTSLDISPLGALASAVVGGWLIVTSRLMVLAGAVPASIGWVGVASGVASIVAYVLVLLGGFPTTTDASAFESMSPATMVGATLSLLSLPSYAVWAIWSARRLPAPA